MDISRLSKKELESDLDESLRALGVECIDLYWLHRDDEKIPVSYIRETLNDFVKKGKIKSIGASNWKGSRIAQANRYANEANITPFVASQIQWSLALMNPGVADPTTVLMNADEYELYKDLGLSVFAFFHKEEDFFRC